MTELGDALKLQVDLSDRLTKAEKRFEDHKELFLEAYETLAGFMAWFSENESMLNGLNVSGAMRLRSIVRRAEQIAQKAVVV